MHDQTCHEFFPLSFFLLLLYRRPAEKTERGGVEDRDGKHASLGGSGVACLAMRSNVQDTVQYTYNTTVVESDGEGRNIYALNINKTIQLVFPQGHFENIKKRSHTFDYILTYTYSSSLLECSAQRQVFHCKLRYHDCSSAQKQIFHRKLRKQVAVLLGMNRCGSFPMLSAPHSLFSI